MSTIEKNNKYWANSHHDILGGKAQILKTKASGGYWQFRCFITDEKKYVRISLKTKDKQTAIERAEEKFFEIHAAVSSGKKLFGMKLYELVDGYLDYRKKHVESGVITSGRLGTIKSGLNHLLDYKGKNTNISELGRKSVFEYQYYRREKKAHDVTIRNEQSTINAMIRWAYEEGLCSVSKFEFEKLKITEAGRRDTFTRSEYSSLSHYLRTWTSKKRNTDEKIRMEKLLVRDFILIIANTYLRVGEARQLRWKDVLSTDYDRKTNHENTEKLVYLMIRPEISKVRKKREIITRGGQYFNRLNGRSKFTEPEDYVFSDINISKMFTKDKLYKYWHEIMNDLELDYKGRNLTYYSLRHFGITARLESGVSIWDIAKIAGTSATNIESHYGHSSREMMERAAFKRN